MTMFRDFPRSKREAIIMRIRNETQQKEAAVERSIEQLEEAEAILARHERYLQKLEECHKELLGKEQTAGEGA